ncbi:MAG: chemotaxis protein CheC [Planctomycetes bacterium]|nr:chemotaxis protein CheC [Planctomycetota bacterium]
MKLNEIQLDALTEIINIGTGQAANSLSELTGSRIELSVPCLHVCGNSDLGDLAEKFGLDFSTLIQQSFEGDVSGQALLAFAKDSAFDLARTVGGIETDDDELDEELHGILEEIGNIVLNSVMGSVANLLECNLAYTLPKIRSEKSFGKIIGNCANNTSQSETMILFADTAVNIASRDIRGSLLLLFETGDIRVLLSALLPDSVV